MTTPTWAEIIKTQISKALLELHSAMPGKVIKYDAAKQLAEVQPLLKWQKFLPGRALKEVFDINPLKDVPVCHPRAGAKGMHLPLQAGDLVLLVFCDRNIATWRGGDKSKPADPETYEPLPLSGAVALPLMMHDSDPWATALANSSLIHIGDAGGTFDFIAHAQKTKDEISALRSAVNNFVTVFNAHTHPYVDTPVGAAVTSPVASPASPPPSVGSVANSHVKVS